jgi:hypothetical protein
MHKSTIFALAAVATLTLAPTLGRAGDEQTVPLDLPGSEGMPRAGDAQPTGTAPGQPIAGGPTEAPAAPNPDPVAPVEPPPPAQ